MAKDPAFLFYPGDWLGGTMGMTFEEKGAYLELLLFQFNNGKFSEAQAKQVLRICSASVVETVIQKFDTDGTLFWKQRLCDEVDKRKRFSESRRKNAESKKSTSKVDNAYAQHMENRNENNGINKKESDFFESEAQAYLIMSGNYHDVDSARTVIVNNGWPSVKDHEVKALIHHFLTQVEDFRKQDKTNIRSHLRRWLNKQPVDKMREWAKNILENHARRGQRQV